MKHRWMIFGIEDLKVQSIALECQTLKDVSLPIVSGLHSQKIVDFALNFGFEPRFFYLENPEPYLQDVQLIVIAGDEHSKLAKHHSPNDWVALKTLLLASCQALSIDVLDFTDLHQEVESSPLLPQSLLSRFKSMTYSPQSETQIANMFDAISNRYDLLNTILSFGVDRYWRRSLIQGLHPVNAGSLLDVATGTGDIAKNVATHRSDFQEIWGVDISKGMLEIAKTKCADFPQCHFQVMSAENLQFDAAKFDAVTITFGLRNVVHKPKALLEFYRVLKPGGQLLILEFFEPTSKFFAKPFLFYFHKILPRIGALLSDPHAYTYLPKSVASFYSPQNFSDLLETSGFKVLLNRSFMWGACRLFIAQKLLDKTQTP